MPEIIVSYPPNIEEIKAVFPAVTSTSGIIFAWGNTIYNPNNVPLSEALCAHEYIHGSRQTSDENAIIKWWRTYLEDPEFRINEEILGHKAELSVELTNILDRNQRNKIVNLIAQRLSGPVYGNVITLKRARELLGK